jgi:exopolyphosphatase/guanosine-5'-triphosphate,3'-diphosphate pyrophosphatase
MPEDWLHENPLTAAAIAEEAAIWKQVGRSYVVKPRGPRKAA